jgi:hypothetical protein
MHDKSIAALLLGASLAALSGCSKPGDTAAVASADQPVEASRTAGPGVPYSPYTEGDHTPVADTGDRPYFGDTHLHTAYSTDAGMIGNTLGPEDAYRFAKGELVTSSTGQPVRLQRPLDFLVVSDHSENLGLSPAIAEGNQAVATHPWGKKVYDLVRSGVQANGIAAYDMWIKQMNALDDPFKGDSHLQSEMWARETAAAEKYNEPGKFTALIGYEWTSMPNGNNLHRNVIFRDGKAKADQIIPMSAYDSSDPEDLWTWMAAYEQKTGGRALAIPHGGNLSNGLMFDDITLTTKQPIGKAYATTRMKWEPLYEVTQMKGDAETDPGLSPNDEFADFERWNRGSFGPVKKTPEMLRKEPAREALKRGMAYEAKFGVNPFKFGMVGSTDSHTSLPTTQENNFFGKVVPLEPSKDPIRFDEVISGRPAPPGSQMYARETGASGLAAVWAKSNTREAIWDAMSRKEVYATTGTRLRVRVFAGYDFAAADATRADFAKNGYARGVPMGGDLKPAPAGKAPVLVIQALKDADAANLDRVQVIKGWVDAAGKTQEKVYDVAWSGNRKPGADGKVPAVGNTVNVDMATYSNSIGAASLMATWKDPAFDARQRAFYYVRVLEIPTPRWTTYDARFFGVARPKDVPASIQERAYTSPIWYTPGKI